MVGRGNSGWITSKYGRPCPCQNYSRWLSAEKQQQPKNNNQKKKKKKPDKDLYSTGRCVCVEMCLEVFFVTSSSSSSSRVGGATFGRGNAGWIKPKTERHCSIRNCYKKTTVSLNNLETIVLPNNLETIVSLDNLDTIVSQNNIETIVSLNNLNTIVSLNNIETIVLLNNLKTIVSLNKDYSCTK